jgi:endonuclease/exonuclease/phosphatase family metal-dependent hydrolase
VLRVATWNLLHGRSVRDGVVDPDRLAEATRTLDADVLAIQEVDRGAERSGEVDQAAVVAEAMGACWHRFVPAVFGTPGFTPWRRAEPHDRIDDGADARPAYGVALVSRLPVLRHLVLGLPPSPVPGVVGAPRIGRPVMLRDEPRAVIVADLEAPFGPLRVACAHLSFVPGWNIGQLYRVLGRAAPDVAGGTAVVLADLNLPGRLVRPLAPRWRMLASLPSYPVGTPRVQLDHVLGRGPLPPVTAARAEELPVGDHRAVLVELG